MELQKFFWQCIWFFFTKWMQIEGMCKWKRSLTWFPKFMAIRILRWAPIVKLCGSAAGPPLLSRSNCELRTSAAGPTLLSCIIGAVDNFWSSVWIAGWPVFSSSLTDELRRLCWEDDCLPFTTGLETQLVFQEISKSTTVVGVIFKHVCSLLKSEWNWT